MYCLARGIYFLLSFYGHRKELQMFLPRLRDVEIFSGSNMLA
jgi:hypothetical protein